MKKGIENMGYIHFKSFYDKYPVIQMKESNGSVFKDTPSILKELCQIQYGVIAFETYPGVDLDRLNQDIISKLNVTKLVNIETYTKSEKTIDKMLERNLTQDRVFGLYAHHQIEDFYEMDQILKLRNDLFNKKGLTVVYGFGASLIKADVLIFVSITRWEIQLRYRKGLTNFQSKNSDEDILRKYKRGYFVEWRVADRIKENNIQSMNYLIDYNDIDHPKMIDHIAYENSLNQLTNRPFRMVPYFDPGIWGGQWMKEVCNLDPKEQNYAWSFDGVPEENSIRLGFDDTFIEIPAQDLVQFRPKELMGARVYGRFGKKFPIRFDLLDTMEGGNLSLQVHPLTEYIQDQFGMTYTQDESYYILDTKDDGTVYLGFKDSVNQDAFEKDLISAESGEKMFDADKYVNVFPAKKHDHFLIPAGTIHCSGKNTMVLEISACVYIFTFKLWDWGRQGLDGRPRPVHLEHGFKALQYDRNTAWVENQLINRVEKISDYEEITGLHETEFLETRRYTFDDAVDIKTFGSVNMANLVDGQKALITSIDGSFDDYEIHYAETFVVPSTIETFRVKCLDQKGCKLIKAHVR
jgi:mannose-6-phosphate isomerase class I